jgi:hypothetical protein
MIRKIVVTIVCIATTGIFAQEGTVSPYSFFGIGDLRTAGTVENQMMGGIAVYADSIHINLRNPAAYAQLGLDVWDNKGLVVYTAGISNKQFRFRDFTSEERSAVTNLDYLSLGFSLGNKLGMGFGITPYTAVGYNFRDEQPNSDQPLTNVFNGEGGLNRVYYSVGYEIIKNVSIGATINYNFGILESERLQQIEDVQFGSFDRKKSNINGFDFNYAVNYTPAITDKYTLHTSVRVNTQRNLVSKNERRIGSFSVTTGGSIEEINVDLEAQNLKNTEFKIPTTTTLGIGFGENRKWFVGGEYSFQALSAFENPFLGVQNIVYKDASSFAFGGFITPDSGSFSSYLNRITYRAGLRLDKTGMVVSDVDINNFGITFGVGLPLGQSLSNLNLGFELGKRGTTRANLVEESYFKINIGLSLNDRWFQKRKIN